MNRLEFFVHGLVKDRPRLKSKLVSLYQSTLCVIPQKNIDCNLPHVSRRGYYYGFFDKSPFSRDGSRLLAHRVHNHRKKTHVKESVGIGFFDGNDWLNFTNVSQTHGWNWQMGSMLQWIGASNKNIIFNDIDGRRAVSVVIDADSTHRYHNDKPIVHVSADGRLGSSYDFCRVEKAMPGYGIPLHLIDTKSQSRSYFKVFNIQTGLDVFSLSLDEIAEIEPQESMRGAFHFFHHTLFNPSGTRLFFLHRWIDKNTRRWTRMFSIGADGSDLFLFPMREMVSHVTWANDTQIFGYVRQEDLGDGYFLMDDISGNYQQYFKGELNSDGHPTADLKRGLIVTDTYPDGFRNQKLMLHNMKLNKTDLVCRTHLPLKFKGSQQIDLHPRLHPSQDIICIDTGHLGIHSLTTIDVSSRT